MFRIAQTLDIRWEVPKYLKNIRVEIVVIPTYYCVTSVSHHCHFTDDVTVYKKDRYKYPTPDRRTQDDHSTILILVDSRENEAHWESMLLMTGLRILPDAISFCLKAI